MVGDSQMRTYRVFPFWHTAGKLVRLRFDLYDGAKFAIDRIRVVELAMPPAAPRPEFDFTQAGTAWRPVYEATVGEGQNGMQLKTPGPLDFALAPPITISAEERELPGGADGRGPRPAGDAVLCDGQNTGSPVAHVPDPG